MELEKAGAKFEFRDSIGNCAYSVGNGNLAFMLSGHIDQVGLQVQHIDDNGFVYFIKDGGVDPKILPGLAVTILSNNGLVNGIIGKTPIHIEWNSDSKDKALNIKDLKIDIGASDKKEAMDMIQIGNPIAINHPTFLLGKNRISSGGIDDKIGVFITAEVIKRLAHDYTYGNGAIKNLKVFGVACTQEEVGGNGAIIAAKRINPKYSIDYDVTFATDDDCVSAKEWGDIKLGNGGCIAYGPDKHMEMCKDVEFVCSKYNIPYQPFSVGAGMTNTNKIKISSDDCKTLLLSIPERNMHTPVEVCDLRDVESLIDMTYWYIHELDKKLSS
jgi:endoglucanase